MTQNITNTETSHIDDSKLAEMIKSHPKSLLARAYRLGKKVAIMNMSKSIEKLFEKDKK